MQEERFLFPIYPLICLCGALTLDAVQKIYFRLFVRTGQHYLHHTSLIVFPVVFITSLLGVTRILALYKGDFFVLLWVPCGKIPLLLLYWSLPISTALLNQVRELEISMWIVLVFQKCLLGTNSWSHALHFEKLYLETNNEIFKNKTKGKILMLLILLFI